MEKNTSSLYDLTRDELEAQLSNDGVKTSHAQSLWSTLYRHNLTDLSNIKFSPPLQRWIEHNIGREKKYQISPLEVVTATHSSDDLTKKYLLRLADGHTIEAVLMGYKGRFTACVSSQVGCAMGCVFCATGQMGYVRNLLASEIIAQVLHLNRELANSHGAGTRLRNLVLMGMGEPLHNYEQVIKALSTISNNRGINIGPSRISISTVGLVPAILRLAEEQQPYNLAVSLHGATEEQRSALVPLSKKWSLAQLIAACKTYYDTTGKRIFFEWTLISGVNDSPEIAAQLAQLLAGLDAHVNLIPLNPTGGFTGVPTTDTGAEVFQKALHLAGIPNTVRQRRGIDVAAGCGQLKVNREKISPQ